MTKRVVFSSHKQYPEELKVETVKQVVEQGYSIADVAVAMTTHSLYTWVKKYGPDA